MDGDGQTTTKFSGRLFRGVKSYFRGTAHNIFGWIVLDGDGQTTTIFSGGLFRGVNSYFGGTGTTIFLGGLFGDGW